MEFSRTRLSERNRAMTDSSAQTWRQVSEHNCGSIWLTEFNSSFPLESNFDVSSLTCSDTKRMFEEPNAGGNSIISEVLSLEFMYLTFRAKLIKTEMEINYYPNGGSITDYLVKIDQELIAISVCRAMTKPHSTYTLSMANTLLHKKLRGILDSNKTNQEGWSRQILHIWTENFANAGQILACFEIIPLYLKTNTIIIVTVAEKFHQIFRENSNCLIVKKHINITKRSTNRILLKYYRLRRKCKQRLKKLHKSYFSTEAIAEISFFVFLTFYFSIFYLREFYEYSTRIFSKCKFI